MKVTLKRELVVTALLADNFGFHRGDDVDIEVGRHGILIKPKAETAESILQWLKDEHGDEMVTLTIDQILHLLK